MDKNGNADLFKTMNNRILESCNHLMSEIDSSHGKLKTSWGKTLTPGGETKKKLRKSDSRKSESRIGNSTKALGLLSEYIDSLEKLKVEHTKHFIESVRNEIEMLWDNCCYGEEQRKVFYEFSSEAFSEELLKRHEEYLSILKQYYNANKELFKLVLKREKLWAEKVAFENPADGCSRFENRGGTLIKELKRIQVVEKVLPNTEKEIRQKVKSWEKANKKQFVIKDAQYIKYIDQQKSDYKAEQEMKRQAKRLAKQEELLLEISHDAIATKRTSIYDNSYSKTLVSKKFNEESLKELMKPTEASLMKTRLLAKNPENSGEGLSKSKLPMAPVVEDMPPPTLSKMPLKSCGSTQDELPKKLAKMDISSSNQNSRRTIPKIANTNTSLQAKLKSKVITAEQLKELAKPTESSLLKSRLPVSGNQENAIKRRGTSLVTDARKRKLKRRSVKQNYLKERNSKDDSSSSENSTS